MNEQQAVPSDTRVASSGTSKMIAISWRYLLQFIKHRLEAHDDRIGRDDVAQLQGLCAQMDAEAFLPLSSEDVTSPIYRRVTEFGKLVDDVTARLVDRRIASNNGLRPIVRNGVYGRYLRLHGVGAFLSCDFNEWGIYALTPIWLTVYGPSWKSRDTPAVRHALAPLEAEVPPRLFIDDDGFATVALPLLLGAERKAVEDHLVGQIEEIARLLAPLTTGGLPVEDPPPEMSE